MGDRTRVAGLAGILFGVALVLQFVVVPAPPDFDAAAGEIRDYLFDNRSGILFTGLLQLLSVLFFVVFLVGLSRAIRRADDGAFCSPVALIGGVLVAAPVLGAQSLYGAMLWVDGSVQGASDDLVQFVWSATYVLFGASGSGLVLLTGAVAWTGLRDKVVPAATAWISALVALVALAGFSMQLGSDFGPIGLMSFVGLALFAFVTAIPMAMGKVSAD